LQAFEEFEKLIAQIRGSEVKRFRKYPPSFYLNALAHRYDTSVLEGVFANPNAFFTLGIGKTVYCLKTLLAVYGKWDVAKQYIVFMPQDFLKRFEDAIDKKYRIPLIIWDDAGFWIGRQRWQNKFVRAIREFLNVIRTHLVHLMVNAPRYTELARGIREQLNYASFVSLRDYYEDVRLRRSLLQMFKAIDADRITAKRDRPSPLVEYIFRVYFPYYEDYRQMREKYVEIGKQRAEEALKAIAEEAAEELEEIAKKAEPGKKLDSLIDEEELEDRLEEAEEMLDEYT